MEKIKFMNNEKYNQIIDEAYENYIIQGRIQFQKWREENPDTLVNFRIDTKELFLKSIKEDVHWCTGEKNYSQKWGLKIEERELTWEEQVQWVMKNTDVEWENLYIVEEIAKESTPKRLLTVIYKDEKIEIYE